MKLQLVLVLAFAAVMAFGQESTTLNPNELRSYGTGVVLVPIDRVALTITVTGNGNGAADAVNSAMNLQGQLNDTLRNYTVFDVRNGGLYLQPMYSGSSLSFSAHQSLSVVLPASQMPALIDNMIALGASNISFIFTPDFFAVETAQSQSLQLAVVDALYKAEATLRPINYCASNITRIAILNPAVQLPSLTFNLYANMGNLRNSINLGGMNTNNMNLNNMGSAQDNSNNNNNIFANPSPMMLGAASPLIEGSVEEIVSYVELTLSYTQCSLLGSGIPTDITSGLDLSNIVGISGGMFSGSASFIGSSASAFSGSSGSFSGSGMSRRSARSTMW